MTNEPNKINSTKLKNAYSEAVESVDLNALQRFIASGKTAFPDSFVVYLEILELVRSLYSKYNTKSFIVNLLSSKPYSLSKHKATKLFYDAINFFYSDNDVKKIAWKNIYAQHLDNLAYYAIEKDDIDTARKCFMEAAKMRGVNDPDSDAIPDEMLSRPIIIYSMDPEQVGMQTASRHELGEFIDNLPEISERERVRIKSDAGVIDVKLFDDMEDDKV